MKSYQSIQQAIKSILSWLSFGCFSSSNTTSTSKATDPPSALTNTDINITEQLGENRSRGISLRGSARKPEKHKIKSGKVGQIDFVIHL